MADAMDYETPDVFQMARTIATARIIMPTSMVRLSAGRMSFSPIEQAVMFMAGANSIFTGDKLLTTANPAFDDDMLMLDNLGLRGKKAFTSPLLDEKDEKEAGHASPMLTVAQEQQQQQQQQSL